MVGGLQKATVQGVCVSHLRGRRPASLRSRLKGSDALRICGMSGFPKPSRGLGALGCGWSRSPHVLEDQNDRLSVQGMECTARGVDGPARSWEGAPGTPTSSASPNPPVSVTLEGHLTTTSHAGRARQAWPPEGFALRPGTGVEKRGWQSGAQEGRPHRNPQPRSHTTPRPPADAHTWHTILWICHGPGAPRVAFSKGTRAPRPSRHETWPHSLEPLKLPTSVVLD